MTTVFCDNYDCAYIDNGCCTRNYISIGEEHTYGCDEYVAYDDCEEYRKKFYITIGNNGKPWAKAVMFGKSIEYNGRTFFTTGRVTESGDFRVTDKRTGIDAGTFAHLKARWDYFIQKEKDFPDVESLPLAEKVDGKYKIVEKTDVKYRLNLIFPTNN